MDDRRSRVEPKLAPARTMIIHFPSGGIRSKSTLLRISDTDRGYTQIRRSRCGNPHLSYVFSATDKSDNTIITATYLRPSQSSAKWKSFRPMSKHFPRDLLFHGKSIHFPAFHTKRTSFVCTRIPVRVIYNRVFFGGGALAIRGRLYSRDFRGCEKRGEQPPTANEKMWNWRSRTNY